MADILLVFPTSGNDIRGVTITAPLSLLAIAGPLLEDYSVQIIDQRATDDFWGDLESALKTQPRVVGITSLTGTQIYHGIEISKFVKARLSVPVVWGGLHATLYPAQTVAKPYIDYVIRGEGEVAFKMLVDEITGPSPDLEKVPALTFKKDGRIYSTPAGTPLELDSLPRMPWHLVDVEEYTTPSSYLYPGVSRLLSFIASRGCPFPCTYCSQPILTSKYRMMSPKRVLDDLHWTVDQFNLDHILLFDDEFLVNAKWATDIAEGINGKFTWGVQGRVNDLLRVDLKKMERCGMIYAMPGIESGAPRILERIRKNQTVDEVKEVSRRLSETKIHCQVNFMVGFPDETLDELGETIDLALHIMNTNPKAVINSFSPVTPLPGTEMLHQVIRDYDFKEPETLEGWINITRGKQERPWLDAKRVRVIRFLYFTSLFVQTAERYGQKLPIPKFVFRLYSKFIQFRWKRRLYWMDWEIPLMRLLWKWFVNPTDFIDIAKYSDGIGAKESSIEMIPLKESKVELGEFQIPIKESRFKAKSFA
ncbi:MULTISPECIES: B12-binding domain-containing radical SAM protein [unclassified Nitrospina]|uniref:B12-binding domain-containing radical SAM protein n=1 Tax=unclassified Nitrospina TaxID=2638683 RepID=UPI003F94BB9F